ncbi:MAG: NADH-quinone oxidoreductase subunit NuoE [Tissierellia bacterium]|jgi:NADH:ubiquinone oxidoreductase subunit E|nr:NADH-quinone oxidoreductase subunit NuoE [Tissierellia bacterium]MDD3225921.1 NADH-quinone oxidoreductase subunit NuoE [Tissierellia bacterium]MDD3750740.1 NADH-quinone oxidoreductase subunit NuoE [Tissierellia bacterium]MDD4045848.1 NADH-quinone oxidoreductase subunit NuoE [Tissierellia bacterium]MDD4678034.1 NADH-quinone oxidoreductase subunit NuoE [Tissierellia bacterium]
MDVKANEKLFIELKDYIDSVKDVDGSLMQVLHKAQETFGYLPIEVQKFISSELDVPLAEVYGVATFYTQFAIEPKGKHKIGVCLGTACYVKGAQLIMDKLAKELDIKVGETTPDNLFTFEATRCLGCCGLAPVMMIDQDVYGKLEPKKIPEILAKYK